MKALTWHGIHDVRYEDVPDPGLEAPGDVLVRVTRSAVCGSDLHLYHGTVPGLLPGSVLGHEYVGVVEEMGSAVRGFTPGDRVTGPFHTACGNCRPCRRGRWHQCETAGVLGYGVAFGNLAGTQAEIARIPNADVNLRSVPEGVSDEAAIFCGDVLTTAYGAVRNASLEPGETCAIIGCGPVGLCAVQCARVLGAGRVIAIDRVLERVRAAEGFGALGVHTEAAEPLARVNELTDGAGADVVIEAVGGTTTLALAFDLAGGGGRISAVGITAEETFELPLVSSLTRDLQFRIGLANIHRDIDAVLDLVATDRLDPTAIVDQRLPLSRGPEAYALFADRRATKVILEI